MKHKNKLSSIRSMQTDLLFKGLSFSTAGSLVVAMAIVFVVGSSTDMTLAWGWFAVLTIISIYRWLTHYLYSALIRGSKVSSKWGLHFKIGAYAAAVT